MGKISYLSLAALLVGPVFISTEFAQAAPPPAIAKDADILRISQDASGLNDVPWTTGVENRQFSLSSDGSVVVYSSVRDGVPSVALVRLRNTDGSKKLEVSCRGQLPQFDPGNPDIPLFNPLVSANGKLVASGFSSGDNFNRRADYVEVHNLNDQCKSKLILRITTKDKPRLLTGVALSSDGRYLAYSFKEPEAANSTSGQVGENDQHGTARVRIVDLAKVSKTGEVDPSADSSVWSQELAYTGDLRDFTGDLRVIGAVSTPGASAKVIVGRSSGQSDLSVDGAYQQVFFLTSNGDGKQGDLKQLVREVRFGYSDFTMNDSGTLSAFTASTQFSEKNLPRAFAAYNIYDSNRTMDVFAKNYGVGSGMIRISKPIGCSDSDVTCQPNFQSGQSYMSPTGEYVAFMTKADNLSKPDVNYSSDILIYDFKTGGLTAPVRVNGGKQPDNDCRFPAVSSNGKIVAFVSYARNLAKLPDYEKQTDDPVPDIYVAKVNQ